MDDDRVWAFERSLWTGDADHYRALVDEECVMVLPAPPYVYKSGQAIEAVASTPRWDEATLSEGQIMRPQEGLIVIAYKAEASKAGGERYLAYCTSTYRRRGHDEWRVVQHGQTPPLVTRAATG